MNALCEIEDPYWGALESIAAIAAAALAEYRHTARDGTDGESTPKPTWHDPSTVGLAFPGGSRRSLFDPEPALVTHDPVGRLATRAKAIYAARRRRDRVFGQYGGLLADPVWDIMLDLFVAEGEGRTVSVSSSCLAACVAPTTGLRWITSLEGRGLLERTPDVCDRRRCFVNLSASGRDLVERALAEI